MARKKRKPYDWGDPVLERIASVVGAKTKADIARTLNYAPTTVSWWTYRRRNPTFPIYPIMRVSDRYGVSVDWLRTGEGEKYLSGRNNERSA